MDLNVLDSSHTVADIDWVLKHGDPRLKSWPLMKTSSTAYASAISYVVFIKVIAPIMMKNRQPYNLRLAMLIYNTTMVALNSWMVYRYAAYGWFNGYNWRCEPIDYSNNEAAVKILEVHYVYHISKYIEFLDTIFFVLRKKYSQVTFLHVFHHSYMTVFSWYMVKYMAGGYAVLGPTLNAFVHVWMYSYYLLSSFGPSVQKYIWWKRHITNMQMLQFMLIMLSMGQLLLFPPEYCNVRNFPAGSIFLTALTFFCLFLPFYRDQYIKKKNTSKLQ